MTSPVDWHALLRPHIEGRRWLVAMDVLATTTSTVALLHDLGAESCFALGGSAGSGPAPAPELAESHSLGASGPDMMGAIRAAEAALRDLPAELQDRIDAWDPDGSARVISTIFSSGRPIAGRRILGARPASWQALEDKTTIDALWEQLGVPHSKSALFAPNTLSSLSDLTHLDEGHGWVLSGDSRDGFNGGASYVRRVRSPSDLATARAFFEPRCDRVRVMPFLEGIPCSIHGMVFPETVLAFRPVEMLVLRHTEAPTFQYVGAASFWTAPPAAVESMRRLARQVGAALRDRVGYRGVFTIDGVLTSDGFRPTELNPRFGAAIGSLCRGLVDLPFTRLNDFVVEGHPLPFPPEALEQQVMEGSATRRSGSCHTVVTTPYTEDKVLPIRLLGKRFRRCESDDADATLVLGPSPAGCHLFLRIKPDRIPVGPPFGPLAVSGLDVAREVWGLDLPQVEAAREAH